MENMLYKYAIFYRFFVAVCMVLCAVSTYQVAFAEKESGGLVEQGYISTFVASSCTTIQSGEASFPPLLEEFCASYPLLAPDVSYQSVGIFLPKTLNNSGFERHSSSKALHRGPKFPRTPTVSAEFFFFWSNHGHSFPHFSGMRGLVHYVLPPPLSA